MSLIVVFSYPFFASRERAVVRILLTFSSFFASRVVLMRRSTRIMNSPYKKIWLAVQPNINKAGCYRYVMKPALNPSIYGHLIDRYLFNFRIDPDVLESRLPHLKWLK